MPYTDAFCWYVRPADNAEPENPDFPIAFDVEEQLGFFLNCEVPEGRDSGLGNRSGSQWPRVFVATLTPEPPTVTEGWIVEPAIVLDPYALSKHLPIRLTWVLASVQTAAVRAARCRFSEPAK